MVGLQRWPSALQIASSVLIQVPLHGLRVPTAQLWTPDVQLVCNPKLDEVDELLQVQVTTSKPFQRRAVEVLFGNVQPGTSAHSCRTWLSEATTCDFREGPAKFLAKFGGFWSGRTCPLTKSSLARAAFPAGHEGARLRLRQSLERLLKGESLSVATIGPSMTKGTQTQRSWPSRLQDLFERLGLKVNVTNLAKGGTTSQWAVSCFHQLKDKLSKVDVVLVDYGLNDRIESADFNSKGDFAVQITYRNLLVLLISLPNRPAVIDIQTYEETPIVLSRTEATVGAEVEAEVPTNNCSAVDVSTYHHWSVNKELNVPMVSYTDAVCHSNRTYWMQEFKDTDANGSPHPGVVTHDLLARIVLGFFLRELDEVCRGGVHGEDFRDEIDQKMGSHIKCLSKPVTAYDVGMGALGFRPVYLDKGAWEFAEDVKGRPGWIAVQGRSADLAFEIQTQSGWIQVEYLGTYKNIGYVSMWLDDRAPNEGNMCNLNGFWADNTSQSKFSLLKTSASPGNHTLWIRSYGMKFKLLGITAC